MRRNEFESFITRALSYGTAASIEPRMLIEHCMKLYDATVEKPRPRGVPRPEIARLVYQNDDKRACESVRKSFYLIGKKLQIYYKAHPEEPQVQITKGTEVLIPPRKNDLKRLYPSYKFEIPGLALSDSLNSAGTLTQATHRTEEQPRRDTSPPVLVASILGLPVYRWHSAQSPPGALLRADTDRPVPFHGRDEDMKSLDEWCSTSQQIAVRLYTGPGGFGKTRLLIEFCKRARERGWASGFLKPAATIPQPVIEDALRGTAAPVLLVVDYAETRRDELITIIRGVLASGSVLVRIVLLARAPDDWWTLLKGEGYGIGELLSGPATRWHALAPLAVSPEFGRESYLKAAAHFSELLEKPTPARPPDEIEDLHFERVLLLHMAALASVEGVQVEGEDGILDYVLRRERRFWTTNAQTRGIPQVLHEAIGQAMAVLTLGGGATSKRNANQVLRKVPLLKDQPPAVLNAISQLLHSTYPGEKWIEPLLPDLLGEYLVQMEMERDTNHLLDIVFGSTER